MWHFPSDKQKPDQQQGNKFASIKAVPVTCAAHESSGGSSDRTAFCNAQGELALGAFVGLSGITRFWRNSAVFTEKTPICVISGRAMILAVQLRSRRQMKLRGKKFCNESNETQKEVRTATRLLR